jgi:hypothetical protein
MAGVGTKALAQAVLSPGLGPVTLAATPVTFTQPILFSASPQPHRPVRSSAPAVTLTEVTSSHSGSEEEGGSTTPRPATPVPGTSSPTSTPATSPPPSAAPSLASTVERTQRGEVYV